MVSTCCLLRNYILGAVAVVSFLVVSVGVVTALSVFAGAAVVESVVVVVLSELLLAALSELQPAAIEPIIIAAKAILNTCFFIGCL